MRHRPTLLAAALFAGAALLPAQKGLAQMTPQPEQPAAQPAENHPYVGMWVTQDGYIRHELLPNGRYDEARGAKRSAYQGDYQIIGAHIEYQDDTGFSADGDFVDGVLHHAGMVLYRAR